MKVVGVIPARYASTRFPGKPLAMIQGVAMIQRVYEQALKSKILCNVVVATDDTTIFNYVKNFGGLAVMTASSHRSGTERCQEAIENMMQKGEHYDVVINIQGDEPFIQPQQIDSLARLFSEEGVQIATLIKKIDQLQELQSPNVVKVVASQNRAHYFSRSPIPYLRDCPQENWLEKGNYFKHVGMYGYRTSILDQLTQLPPAPLEQSESLEQLRWLENGYSIHTQQTDFESIAIDTPDDLLKVTNKT